MIEIFRSIHSFFFWFLVFFYCVIINISSNIAGFFIKDPEKRIGLYHKGALLWGKLLVKASFITIKVTGIENIPEDESVIFTPNHQSIFDTFILLSSLPKDFSFIIMRKLFKVTCIGNQIRKAGYVSLDTKDRKHSLKILHSVVDQLKKGRSFLIFPEGKLTKDGTIGEFMRGASIIIQKSKKPVIPIAIDGSFAVLPKGAWKIHPGEVRVNIGKPVIFDDIHGGTSKENSQVVSTRLHEMVARLKEKR